MHSSRMRTARSLSCRGVSLTETPLPQTETCGQRPPWTETPKQRPLDREPPDRDPPWRETLLWTETIGSDDFTKYYCINTTQY